FLGGAAAGAVVVAGAPFWVLLGVAVTGTLSTDVVDNGPATTLEQVMLAGEDAGTSAVYGRYNSVGAAAGALGGLAAGLPVPRRDRSAGRAVRRGRGRRWTGPDRVPVLLLRGALPRLDRPAGLAVLHRVGRAGGLGSARAAAGSPVRAGRDHGRHAPAEQPA